MKSLQTCRVNIMVSDMDRAVNFYQDKLGLKLLNRYENYYAEIQAPDLLIGLHPSTEKITYGNNISIGLGVTDFDAAKQELVDKGFQLSIEQDSYIRLAYFTDPDGNQLFLAERKD